MPRTLTAATSAAVQQDATYLATCWKVELTNGTTYGFTSHVATVTVSSVVYEAKSGYTPSSVDSSNRWNVDNLEVEGVVTGTGINVADIQAGNFDGAAVTMFQCDYRAPDDGQIIMRTGTIGNITRRDNDFTAELRGLLQSLQQITVQVYTPACRAALGDDQCKVPVSAPFWTSALTVSAYVSGDTGGGTNAYIRSPTLQSRFFKATTSGATGTSEPAFTSTIGGTTADGSVTWETIYAWKRSAVVSSVTNRQVFTLSDCDEPNEHWKLGIVEWKTGDNVGRSMEVKANVSAGRIELYLPMAAIISAGDVAVITAGCANRLIEDCQQRFNNIWNFRGEPYIPGRDALVGGEKKR